MYSVTYLYSTGIRGKGVSLKNTELYLPVRLEVGLMRGEGWRLCRNSLLGRVQNKVKQVVTFSEKLKTLCFAKKKNYCHTVKVVV